MKKLFFLFCMGCFCVSVAQTLSKTDRRFVRKAAENSLMEVKFGLLSGQNTNTPEVANGGLLTAAYHKQAMDTLRQLARKKNILLPITLSESEQSRYDKMTHLQGTKFDTRYVNYMIEVHARLVTLFAMEVKKGKDAELKTWASTTLVALKQHLQMWKDLQKGGKK